jgi:hypothetical protein
MKKQKLLNYNSNKWKVLLASRLKMESENAEGTRFAIPLRTILILLLSNLGEITWRNR